MEGMEKTMDKAAMTDDQLGNISGGTILPYEIKPGDTLASIAAQYNVTADQLVKWNNIQNPGTLMPGQKLKLKF